MVIYTHQLGNQEVSLQIDEGQSRASSTCLKVAVELAAHLEAKARGPDISVCKRERSEGRGIMTSSQISVGGIGLASALGGLARLSGFS